MKLEKNEREALKDLVAHKGFKVLENIVKQMEYDLLSKFKTLNISDEGVTKDLINSQMMLSGGEYLIDTAKQVSKTIKKKEV